MKIGIIWQSIKSFFQDFDAFVTAFILFILGLDSIRQIIAYVGLVPPTAKFAWIIYGRYPQNIFVEALKELGFEDAKRHEILESVQRVARKTKLATGVTKDNAPEYLIVLISKYIKKLRQPIQYGGERTTTSEYYIDTMEMSHNKDDIKLMVALMVYLYLKSEKIRPTVVVGPKGGNPLFTNAFAEQYNATCVFAKSDSDKSRIISKSKSQRDEFEFNYEGSWSLLNPTQDEKCIVVDCNVSGGSQVLRILANMNEIADELKAASLAPTTAYVLFRADTTAEHDMDIDSKFKSHNYTLKRYFDLTEGLKSDIYAFKESLGGRDADLFIEDDRIKIDEIIRKLQSEGLYHYE